MDDIVKVVKNLYEAYKCEMYEAAKETHLSLSDAVSNDLADKGFSEKEISEILSLPMNEDAFYKLGAYMIALFNQPETYEEWKASIKKDIKINLPEEEIKKLWNAYQKIDY